MPEVRVQLSDEQAERLRARSAWSRTSVADDVLDACTAAVREQLPPPIKVGDRVRSTCGVFVWDVVGIDGKSAWLRRDGDEGVRRMDCLVELLVRVEEGE